MRASDTMAPQPAKTSANAASPSAAARLARPGAGRHSESSGTPTMLSRRDRPETAKSRISSALAPRASQSVPSRSGGASASATDGSSERSVCRTFSASAGSFRTASRRNQVP